MVHIHRTSECYHKMQHAEICPDPATTNFIIMRQGLLQNYPGVEISR